MGNETGTHILVFPSSVQSHINPMLQFSKRLVSKGLTVTLVTSISIANSTVTQPSSIHFETLSQGDVENKNLLELDQPSGIKAHLDRERVTHSHYLGNLIQKMSESENPPKFLVYDSGMPWALDVARSRGLDGAPFFTQTCTVSSIYYHLYQGTLGIPIEDSVISLPEMPLMRIKDLPSFVYDPHSYAWILRMCLNQFSNFHDVKFIFLNTFDKLEPEVVKWMKSQWPVEIMTIGPTVPLMGFDDQDKDYGVNLCDPNNTCIKWLDNKQTGSVIFVSFGSLFAPGEDQMAELASALKRLNNFSFLWVVKSSEAKKLPKNFVDETCDKGLVVSWCSQIQVLAHKSLGCFITHCGWNSTIEALSLGVPMVAMPQWADQTTNAMFVADVWKVGVRVQADEKGIVRRDEIELCIGEVMEDGFKRKLVTENVVRWKDMAKEALVQGGSSDKHIDEFISKFSGM